MQYVKTQNGKVTDAIVCNDASFAASIGYIYAESPVAIGWSYDGVNFTAPPAPVVPVVIPPVSPRQIRMALTQIGLRAQVEAAVAAGDQNLKDWWEFSTQFERNNAEVIAMGAALGVPDAQLDSLWQLAKTL